MMKENIRIVPMTKEHVDSVIEIEELSFSIPWAKEAFEMEVTMNKCATYIVAMIDDVVTGYGGFWAILDEAHITNIAVHPDYRGIGVGNALLEGLIEAARKRGATSMTLEVRASNEIAQNLYRKYGFKAYGRRKGYYQDNGEDAIIMWKYDL
ncbi:MAG: ribosomal protein S18-alanine N-acetyltransferase [Thermoanaerobacteraceae bacterium]|nr:ribosomal protein S18-alanine N-acetyltransferase [Thermoanaerobacteraceae bacterium]